MVEELDSNTLRIVLDRLGGDTYNRAHDPIKWKEIWEHVQWLEKRAYTQGRKDGIDSARKTMRTALGMETWKP